MTNLLEFRLFGHPEIRIAGQLLDLKLPHKALALLYYLALAEQPVGRETVALFLWPDAPPATAKHSLRNLLSLLRKVLGDAIAITNRTVALQPTAIKQVDVVAFQQGLATIQKRQAYTAPDLAMWQATLTLYRGDFLDGFYIHQSAPFEEWTTLRREQLRQQLTNGLLALSEAYAGAGEAEAALAALAHLLALDPQSETVYSRQIQLLLGLGRRTDALQQYERYRKMLATEFNIAPDPALTALVAELRTPAASLTHLSRGAQAVPTTVVNSGIEPWQLPTLLMSNQPTDPAIPHNLVKPLTAFVGREQELAYLSQRLIAEKSRLLTIVGFGGMGKTSLAQAAAQRLLQTKPAAFADGIYFVSLAGLTSAPGTENEGEIANVLLVTAIAEQIGCTLQPGLPALAQLQNYLRQRRLLLILDNFEHLLAATTTLLTLLTHAPALSILVTSRTRLKVRGEIVLPLGKLTLPAATYLPAAERTQATFGQLAGDDIWQESEAVAMFVQRAQCLDPYFALSTANLSLVIQICYLVDGLPLGIELATSMLPMVSCAELVKELRQSLAFLTAETYDLPSDQRTLAAVFERSWRLLPTEGQLLLAKLAIFPSSFDYAAAVQITDASSLLLQRLIDHSLLNQVGDKRYCLHHIVRTFAAQKLQQGPAQVETLQVKFAHFYLGWLAELERQITGPAYAVVIEQIQVDWDNLRAAWRWGVNYQLAHVLRRCINTLFWFYEQHGFYLEVLDLYEYALRTFLPLYMAQPAKAGTDVTWLTGRLQTCVAVCYNRLGRFQEALATYEASWAILENADSPDAAAACLGHWGMWLKGSDPQRSAALLTEALRLVQRCDITWMHAIIAQLIGETLLLFGDYTAAEAHITTGLDLGRELNWPRALVSGHKALGRVHLACGRYHQAEKHLRESLDFAQRYQLKSFYIESMTALGEALRLQGRLAEAKVCFAEGRTLAERLGFAALSVFVCWEEGCLAEQCGEYQVAKTLFNESMAALQIYPWWSHALPTLGWALIGLGELAEAQAYFQKVLTEAEAQARLPISLDAQVGLAYIGVLRAGTGQLRLAELNTTEQFAVILQRVHQHPATAQETRARMAKLFTLLGLPHLAHTPFPVSAVT